MNEGLASRECAERRFRIGLVVAGAVLFSAFVVGLAATSPPEAASLTLAYTRALHVLPCTLPVALVIAPLSLGRTARRG